MCLTADKHQITHRILTNLMASIVSAGGGDINKMSLSRATINRHRNRKRKDMATNIHEENTKEHNKPNKDSISHLTGSILHWDGKMLKALKHAKSNKSVMASFDHATKEKGVPFINY